MPRGESEGKAVREALEGRGEDVVEGVMVWEGVGEGHTLAVALPVPLLPPPNDTV